MTSESRSFSECLRDIAAKHGWSSDDLAKFGGYKSRTSIIRLFQEQSSHKNREAFLRRLCGAGVLKHEEESALRKALEISAIGKTEARARQILQSLIMGTRDPRAVVFSSLDPVMHMMRDAVKVDVIVFNSMYESLMNDLQELLVSKPGCRVSHYFSLTQDEVDAAMAVKCLALLSYLPNYVAYACNPQDEDTHMICGLNAICVRLWDEEGASKDILALLFASGKVALHQADSAHGLYAFCERVVCHMELPCQSVSHTCGVTGGPESFLSVMRYLYQCELQRDMYHIKSDLCVNTIHPRHLRACLVSRQLDDLFRGQSADTMRKFLDSILDYQRQRYKNMIESKNPKHLIASPDAFRRFCRMGMITEHFAGMRPFTLQERIEILEDLFQQATRNPFFFLYFFKDGIEPAYEINCWDRFGLTAFPIKKQLPMALNYCNSVICHPRLVSIFKGYFMNDLIKNHTMSNRHGLMFLRELLSQLHREAEVEPSL